MDIDRLTRVEREALLAAATRALVEIPGGLWH